MLNTLINVAYECESSCGFTLSYSFSAEKAMAPHSSTLAWKIPWAGEPGGLQLFCTASNMTEATQQQQQGCRLSPCLFNLYAEYTMRNTGLDEAQAGIKTAGRNINNLRYADDTTLMAESEEELQSPLMNVKEKSEKVGLNLNIQKTNIMASGPITSWQIDEETMETVADFVFLDSTITADGDCSHEI